jgi:hypothetical protein
LHKTGSSRLNPLGLGDLARSITPINNAIQPRSQFVRWILQKNVPFPREDDVSKIMSVAVGSFQKKKETVTFFVVLWRGCQLPNYCEMDNKNWDNPCLHNENVFLV